MAMIAAKRGARPSDVKITIRKQQKNMTFSTGFFRLHNINAQNTGFVRLGFDEDSKEIGLEFLEKDDGKGEALKLAFSKPGTSASCPCNPILISFGMSIDVVAGVYGEKAIEGPMDIKGFAKNAFKLKVSKKAKGKN